MQAAQHQCAVELFLLWKAGDDDRFEAHQRLTRMFEIVGNCLIGKIAQAIVVAIVSNLGGKFRLGAQRVFPLIGEQAIEFVSSGFEWLLGGLGEERDDESCGERNNDERCLQEADLQNAYIYENNVVRKISEKGAARALDGGDECMARIGVC